MAGRPAEAIAAYLVTERCKVEADKHGLPASQQFRNDGNLHLIDQARSQILSAAAEP